ncbi:MAG TPA: PQQ-binding-like beta-propeller repeat protein [Gemmataceae bacterium]|nr:PQQ-binding-like beta-propeller repeat protein [Gemmataceae bacterium]
MHASRLEPLVEKRTFLSRWSPVAVAGLWAGAAGFFWLWPASWDRHTRVMGLWSASLLACLALVAWWFLFARAGWAPRLVVPVCIVVLGFFSIRDVQFKGDMKPIIRFVWNRTADDVLEAHRHRQVFADDLPAVDLADGNERNFPEYRGRRRDGVVEGPALARDWEARPPRELWRQPAGGGYASFAVAGNLAVTIEQRRDREAVVAYDTATGRERWTFDYLAHFVERLGGPGPRATPTIAGDAVFSLGATGMLVCLDAKTGDLRWSANILKDNDNITWGMSGSPLVFDDVVVVNPGAQRESNRGNAVIALDRATGKEKWRAGNGRAGYSSPMLATLANERQVLLLDAEGLSGYDPAGDGELWRFPFPTYQGINVCQPVVLDGDRVFISAGYDVGAVLVQVTHTAGKWSASDLWRTKAMRCKFTSPVAYQGHLYGLDEGVLTCLDAATGARKWREGHYGHGQVLRAGDLLVILAESGELALVEATPAEHRQLGIIQALDANSGKTWNNPALADGKVFVRNHQEMACYGLR